MFTLCHVIHLIIHNIQKNIITKKSNVTSLALFLFVKTDQSQINSIVVYPPNDNINRRKSHCKSVSEFLWASATESLSVTVVC